jgi:hypothetical protein
MTEGDMTSARRSKLHLKFAPTLDIAAAIASYAPPPPPPPPTSKARLSTTAWLDLVIDRLEDLRRAWPAAFRPCDDLGVWPPLQVGIHCELKVRRTQ